MSLAKKSVKRMSLVSGGGDEGFESSSSSSGSVRRSSTMTSSSSSSSSSSGSSSSGATFHQVYRGMSPTTASRLENRVKELEDLLEQERNAHVRTEQELTEIRISFEGLHERLEEAETEISSQLEINRRKEQEFLKLKKDFESNSSQYEESEAVLKKRHQEIINDLNDQLDKASKAKSKVEKEKQQLTIEIETYTSQLDASNKAKSYSDSKLEALEEQVRKLKIQVDELTRINQDLLTLKAKLTQENSDFQHQLHEIETSFGSASKIKIQIQQQLDEAKTKYEDESRARAQLELQISGLLDEVSSLKAQLGDEAEAAAGFKAQSLKWQNDFQQLKGKYDKDVVLISEELEEVRRKLTLRVTELEAEVEAGKVRANRAEKDKNKLSIEINEIILQLEGAENAANESAKRLKQAEHSGADLHKRVEELTIELSKSSGDNDRLKNDVANLKKQVEDLQSKVDVLTRENNKLTEALRESESSLKDITRQSQEWATIKIEITAERDALGNRLGEAEEALRDAHAHLDAASGALNQSKSELDARLREKDEEVEGVRRSSQRTIEELQRSLIELENRTKGEAGRLRKKFETEIHEFEIQIDSLNRGNADLLKNNKTLSLRLKDLEIALDGERRSAMDARDSAAAAEKKIVTLLHEIENIRVLYDGAEKARKHAESELHDSTSQVNEINITITALTSDKRRLEGDLTVAARERDDAVAARRSADERIEKLTLELTRLNDLLRVEKETTTKLESVRKQLEVSIREVTIRLEEVESTKDGKKSLAKFQARVTELEQELELVSRREREAVAEISKLRRQLAEFRSQNESDQRLIFEYSEQINVLNLRIVTIKRQLEQSEEVLNITMSKYRKTQQLLEEAERRADRAETGMTVVRRQSVVTSRVGGGVGGGSGGRSMSFSSSSRLVRS